MNKLTRSLIALAGLVLAACGAAPRPQIAPQPTAAVVAMWQDTCHAVVQEHASREIEPDELAACLALARGGNDVVGLRAWADTLPKADPPVAEAPAPEAPPSLISLQRLHVDGRVFRTEDGQPWRYKGVSAFQLLDRYVRGEDLGPFLRAYAGFNVLRVWPYVPVADWGAKAWGAPPSGVIRDFIAAMGRQGFYVELTLLTSDDAEHLAWAQAVVPQIIDGGCPANLLLEAGNEPTTHKAINTAALRGVLAASGCLYASGDYEDSSRAFGSYLVAHTSRDSEWPRRAHDALEYFNGGGPNTPQDPAHRVPVVLDEPTKFGDSGIAFQPADWRAYFGAASLLGAGATFHSETGKYAQPPTSEEGQLAAAALEGLNAFPADAPNGPYSRPDDATLRTYIVGSFMVRIRPTGAGPSGWTAIDSDGILWRR
jgi:hypothetical protein